MTTIALYNLKGGVGKTASCVNLAYLSAADGFKTLLWDIDPQGSSTFYYHIRPKANATIKNLVGKEAHIAEAVMGTDFEMLDVIPADVSSRALDEIHEEMKSTKTRMRSLLRQVAKEYEFVFLDCPPGFSSLSENIFNAADVVLMPVIPTTLSVRTYQLVKTYFKEKDIDLGKLVCFFTMADLRKNMHNQIMEELFKDKKFLENYVPYLSDVEKMGAHQAPVMEYANSSYAAKCYRDLWNEIKTKIL